MAHYFLWFCNVIKLIYSHDHLSYNYIYTSHRHNKLKKLLHLKIIVSDFFTFFSRSA